MKDDLENFIQDNRENFDKKAPDSAVLNRILEQMQQKKELKPRGFLIPFQVVRWAAVVFTLIAFGTAFWIVQRRPEPIVKTKIKSANQQKFVKLNSNILIQTEPGPKETPATKTKKIERVDLIDRDLEERQQALLAKLKTQSVHAKKQVMFAGLNDMDSPASRIEAASGAYRLINSSNDIVNALVKTLNTDPNANVRLAALDGLNRFYRESYVRKKLLASLKKQQDPVVQIALINLLIRIRESGILEELEKMTGDEHTEKAVKDCAYSGIIRLQSS